MKKVYLMMVNDKIQDIFENLEFAILNIVCVLPNENKVQILEFQVNDGTHNIFDSKSNLIWENGQEYPII